ncbi:MAG: hypothetical protein ABJN69_06115 [Hellea sp.]
MKSSIIAVRNSVRSLLSCVGVSRVWLGPPLISSVSLITLMGCSPNSNRAPDALSGLLPTAERPESPYNFDLDLKALRSDKPVSVPKGCIIIKEGIEFGTPMTIREPGNYCLADHIFADTLNRAGIVIAADDVTLDLNGRTIVSLLPETKGFGVRADARNNVTVKNGNIHNFLAGVHFRNVGKASVKSIDASGNLWRGIVIDGQEAVVTDSHVEKMLGYKPWANSPPIAYDIKAPVCDVSGNSFAYIRSDLSNKFINNVSKADACVFDNNSLGQSDPSEATCFSITQPMSITFGGDFCLENDIFVDTPESPGLDIRASNVNIDLGGHTIFGPGALSQAAGITINGGKTINVNNGTVRAFDSGIEVNSAQDVTLQDLQNAYHNRTGLNLTGSAISVENVVIRSIVGRKDKDTHPLYGIQLDGADIKISHSEITDVSSPNAGQASAINNINSETPFTFTGNKVANVQYFISTDLGNDLGNDLMTENTISISCGISPQQKGRVLTPGDNSVSIIGTCLN